MGDYENTVTAWIREHCMKGKAEMELTTTTPLLVTDILDSLDFMGLVEYLSQEYSVDIDEDDMSPDNFESVETISKLLYTLKSA